MIPNSIAPQLDALLRSKDFVLKTQQQVATDFTRCGFEFDENFTSTPLTYDDAILAISTQLAAIMALGETQTLQLLYQIDIPQADFLGLTQEEDFITKMSHMILVREAYKVYLRSKF
jgi:hypothetical protein